MKKNISLVFFALLVHWVPVMGSMSQSAGITCRHFNILNGILSSNIEYVHVDREGYVWFATSNGLQQFDGYNFTNYIYNAENNSSISYNFISTISEDREGNIWIGLLGKGVDVLNKQKGTFKHLFSEPALNHIPGSLIFRKQSLAPDSEGYMWLNSNTQMFRIRPGDYMVEQHYGDFTGEFLYDNEQKVFWIASNVLKRFDPATKTIDYHQISTGKTPTNTLVNSLKLDQDGLIWLGTTSGLIIFDKAANTFFTLDQYLLSKALPLNSDLSWSSKPIESVYIDNAGLIWMAIDKSIVKLDKNKGTYRIFAHESYNPHSLLDDMVAGIFGDGSGIMWIAYKSLGVSRVAVAKEVFTHYRVIPGNPNSLSGNAVRSVYQDQRQNLWIGNYSDGLNRILPHDPSRVIHYKADPTNPATINSNYITSIFVDKKERLWVGTFDKGFCYADNIYTSGELAFTRFHFDTNLEVENFCEDIAGNIWIGTQHGLFFFDYAANTLIHYGAHENQLPETRQINVQSMVFEPPDILWISSWNRGICKLTIKSDSRLSGHASKDSLIFFENLTDERNSKIDNCFITLYKHDNVLWLGSNVNGLVKMTIHKNRVEVIKYDKSKGAPGNSVYGIEIDREGMIWVSSNHGMGKFDPQTERFYNYYQSDGLISNAFMWNSHFKNPQGKIFFGEVGGLVSFYPEQLKKERANNEVHISKLIIQNKELQIGDKINGRQILTNSIQYTKGITFVREPAFTIEFVAVNPLYFNEIVYSYILEGFDKEWIHSSSGNRTVTYTNLRPGNYTFLVRALNNIGDPDQNTTALTIKILPPWWQTTFALTAFSVLFILLLFLLRWLILMRIRLVHEARYEHMERQKSDELFQYKMCFFTDISHEFGNLLSLILSPLQHIASKVGNDPHLAEQSRLIRKNSERLLRLTEQVIDMRKIDLNKMKLSLREGDIIAYIKELTFSFREMALERSMTLEFDSLTTSFITWFDENKTDRIICNLLTNAFKFTPEGGKINVSIAITNNPDIAGQHDRGIIFSGECLEIRVRDNGVGIPLRYQDQIFERFLIIERGDSILRRGTGLGLALTKELVDLQKGKIRFESEENKGTCFIVQLPVIKEINKADTMIELLPGEVSFVKACASENSPLNHDSFLYASSEEKSAAHNKVKPIVLLVEDDQEIRAFISKNLKPHYQVYEADDGVKAIDISLRIDPDIIISDTIMHVMSGVEMCRKVKSDPRTSHIPVILLTARSGIDGKMEGFEAGADAYVEKPFIMELLDAQINNILIIRKVLRNKFSKELVVKPADITITPLNAIILDKAMAVVEKNISNEEFSSDEFAREMGMSRSRLHRKLKSLCGQAASEFIHTIRMKRAAVLIENSQLSIEEISNKVGINSPAYFTKCFKKHSGKTPTEFKNGQPR